MNLKIANTLFVVYFTLHPPKKKVIDAITPTNNSIIEIPSIDKFTEAVLKRDKYPLQNTQKNRLLIKHKMWPDRQPHKHTLSTSKLDPCTISQWDVRLTSKNKTFSSLVQLSSLQTHCFTRYSLIDSCHRTFNQRLVNRSNPHF